MTAARRNCVAVGSNIRPHEFLRTIQTPYKFLKSPELYRRGVSLAMDHALGIDTSKKITIDQYFGNKIDNGSFKAYLRQAINQPKHRVSDFAIEDSEQVDGIQAVDLAVGAVGHFYTEGEPEFRHLLRNVLEECYWPKNE